jgi:hypothetical protein
MNLGKLGLLKIQNLVLGLAQFSLLPQLHQKQWSSWRKMVKNETKIIILLCQPKTVIHTASKTVKLDSNDSKAATTTSCGQIENFLSSVFSSFFTLSFGNSSSLERERK